MTFSRRFAPGRIMVAPAIIVAMLGGCLFFDEVDRCLDRGGSWNDTTEACELGEAVESTGISAAMRFQLTAYT